MSEDALLRGIAAEPADDVRRLVLADWLDEHGEPQHAEFLRTQIELARTAETDPSFPALLARSRRCGLLTDPPRRPFLDHIPGGKILFRRGLIAGVVIGSRELLRTRSEDWDVVPLEQMILILAEGTGDAVARRPELAKLHTLQLAGRLTELRPLLCGCPHLAGLRALRVNVWQGDRDAISELFRNLDLPALDSIAVTAAPGYARALLDSFPATLRRLDLTSESADRDAFAGDVDWEYLESTRHWPHLESANLSMLWNHAGWGDVENVTPRHPDRVRLLRAGRSLRAVSATWFELEELLREQMWVPPGNLQVSGCPIANLEQLGSVERFRNLDSLEIFTFDPDTDPAPVPRGWGESLTGLRRLRMFVSNFNPETCDRQIQAMLAARFLPQLWELELSGRLTRPGFDSLARVEFPNLTWLSVRDSLESLEPVWAANGCPHLSTVAVVPSPSERREMEAVTAIAVRRWPHLSLIAYSKRAWVLADGEAVPVRGDVYPVDADWWESHPGGD